MRMGPNCQKMNRDDIAELCLSEGRFRYDESLCHEFDCQKDLSLERFNKFIKLTNITTVADSTDLLLSLNVCEKIDSTIKMTNVGVLFFADDPQRFVRESHLICVKYAGEDRFTIEERSEIRGDLITQVEKGLLFF